MATNVLEIGLAQRHRFDIDDYRRLGEAGILDEDSRVELIEGEIIDMAPIGDAHAYHVTGLTHLLVQAVGDRARVAVQNPVVLDRRNEPQPDFVLIAPRPGGYRKGKPRPADVLLLIEVADSTLAKDRKVKLPLYARAGIVEVWILDVVGERLEVYREPEGDGYRDARVLDRSMVLEPTALPGIEIAVARLFE